MNAYEMFRDMNMSQLTSPEAVTSKRKYGVYVHTDVEPGQTVYNKLENTNYTVTLEKNVVISGSKGEQWVTDVKTLNKTYDLSGEKDPETGFQTAWTKTGRECCAVQIPRDIPLEVPTSWGEIMTANSGGDDKAHGTGDFLVYDRGEDGKPVEGTQRVVAFDVFNKTYNPVPGAVPEKTVALEDVPVPVGYVQEHGVTPTEEARAQLGNTRDNGKTMDLDQEAPGKQSAMSRLNRMTENQEQNFTVGGDRNPSEKYDGSGPAMSKLNRFAEDSNRNMRWDYNNNEFGN